MTQHGFIVLKKGDEVSTMSQEIIDHEKNEMVRQHKAALDRARAEKNQPKPKQKTTVEQEKKEVKCVFTSVSKKGTVTNTLDRLIAPEVAFAENTFDPAFNKHVGDVSVVCISKIIFKKTIC